MMTSDHRQVSITVLDNEESARERRLRMVSQVRVEHAPPDEKLYSNRLLGGSDMVRRIILLGTGPRGGAVVVRCDPALLLGAVLKRGQGYPLLHIDDAWIGRAVRAACHVSCAPPPCQAAPRSRSVRRGGPNNRRRLRQVQRGFATFDLKAAKSLIDGLTRSRIAAQWRRVSHNPSTPRSMTNLGCLTILARPRKGGGLPYVRRRAAGAVLRGQA